jgi:hypothetical protein
MTIACAWLRRIGDKEELLFASDSRLRWAGAWDSCPKVFLLPRSDALMAFAGDTLWAYPIIIQTINNIAAFEPSRERRYDLLDARGHALRVINAMIARGDAIYGPDPPQETADFLFGGFSAREGRFRLWRFFYVPESRCFQAEAVRQRRFGMCRFIGDVDGPAARDLQGRIGNGDTVRLDMEPLEVIRDLLRSGEHPTIGGPPQLAKAYRHMNSEAFAVRWRSTAQAGESTLSLLGRQLLDYEELGVPLLDADYPSPAPEAGRGEELASWDRSLSEAVRALQVADAEKLVTWCELEAVSLTEDEVSEWLDYACRRGLLESYSDTEYVIAARGSETGPED